MRMFDVPLDETSLRCVEFGGYGNVCMLLHGLGDGWFVWEQFAGQLANQSRVLAVDLRGHGDSSWSRSGDYSFDAFAWDILALCERLKLRHITLVGHSAGAGVALRVAERRPDLVRALVLVDFGPLVNRPDERVSSTMCERFDRAARVYASASEYVQALRTAHPFVYESLLARIAHFSLRLRADGRSMELKRDPAVTGFFEACRRTGDASSLWYLLAQTMCPTLLVRGEVSGLLPADVAEKMVSTLPQGHYVEVSFAAHSVMLDNPEDFADAVLPFLASKAVMPRRIRTRSIKPQKNETLLNSNQHWPAAQESAPTAGSRLQNPG
jgi:pimeloyl-ACP methyl ester carboxylesterase